MEPTEQQKAVVSFNSGDLVVTASAGSGKTRVMTERFCRLVIEGKANVDEILCVTFTKLAAGELKKRLAKGLRNSLPDHVTAENKAFVDRMNEQISLIPTSSICTIDSFCSNLVKKYFYVVKVDPQYSIIEEAEEAAMKQDAIDELFERLYEEGSEDILLLLKSFAKSRKDDKLKELIISVHNFLSSEIDKKAYLDRNEFLYSKEGADYAVNGLIDLLLLKCKALFPEIDKFIEDSKKAKVEKYSDYFGDLKGKIESIETTKTIDQVLLVCSNKKNKPPIKYKDNFILEELYTRFDSIRKKIVDQLDDLKQIFGSDIYTNSANAERIFKSLRRVVDLFEEEFQKEKQEKNVLNFADLEYYTYEILKNEEALNEIRSDYKYIFVDEYQDTNAIQDAIFSKLQNDNMFIVGDMKQSIYAFRGCDCKLFEKRIADTTSSGKVISLDKNFRSTKAVIDCVNNIFSTIMTKDSINLDYANNNMEYGGLYPNNGGKAVIVQHLESEKDEVEKLPFGIYGIEKHLNILKSSRTKKEEVTIRKLIESVHGETYIDENGNEKNYGFSDIAVISRTNKSILDRVAAELVEAGIPVLANSKRSVGDYPEIRTLISILECINYDGMEDFSLATTLKSPVANFSDEELMAIRNAFPKEATYFKAVSSYRDSMADELSKRLKLFFKYLDKLRLLANYKNVSEVLKTVIADSNFEIYILKTTLGDVKQKRINRFVNELEGMSSLTVSEFLRNKDCILENMTISFTDGDDAVKLLNIHQSKGLEFPIVILCETDRGFFTNDNKQEIITSRKNGIGINSYDYAKKLKANTVQRSYINKMLNLDTLQDEMRLFYVATTRAEHRLYIVTTAEIPDKISPSGVLFASKYSDFLDKSMCEFITSDEIMANDIEKQDVRPAIFGEQPTQAEIDKIGKFLKFTYPYESDTKLSLKTTVTEATRRIVDDMEYTPVSKSGSIDTGNAYHRFLQLSSFDGVNVEAEMQEFLKTDKLSEQEYSLLDSEKLKNILSNEIFEKLKGFKLYREQPFMCLVPAKMIGEKGTSEVLIQGVIDLLAINGDSAVIVDYKFSGLSDNDLVHKYHGQLELYGYAVEKVLKKKVENMFLLNINTVSPIKIV